MDDETSPITVSDADGVAVVTYDDGKANTLSVRSMDLIEEAVTTAAASSPAVVLAGRPGIFCAGLDMSVAGGDDAGAKQALMQRIGTFFGAMTTLSRPLVAACTGHSIASGALLLLACDYRVGATSDRHKFGLPETALGMTMGPWALSLAKGRLDRKVLLRATVLSETIVGTAIAADWGYLDELVAPEDVLDTAVTRAKRLGDSLPSASFQKVKAAVLEA